MKRVVLPRAASTGVLSRALDATKAKAALRLLVNIIAEACCWSADNREPKRVAEVGEEELKALNTRQVMATL